MVLSSHFSCLPVVVHAWLTILGRVDGVSLAKLDPPSLLQRVEVPADEGVKVWVGICCDEGASPVNLCVCVRVCACTCVSEYMQQAVKRTSTSQCFSVFQLLSFLSENDYN